MLLLLREVDYDGVEEVVVVSDPLRDDTESPEVECLLLDLLVLVVDLDAQPQETQYRP